MKYCVSVCTGGAPFDGTGKSFLVRMFGGAIAVNS